MTTFLIVLHVIVSLFLIAVVLLQRGKGAEIGAVFGGGGSSTVFGSRGAGNFLTKLTTVSATLFMLTSLGLSYLFTTATTDVLFGEATTAEQEAAVVEQPIFEEIETVPAAEPPTAEPQSESGLPALPEPTPSGDPG
jgi:preprotein translocase subunit SecG